MTDLLLSPHNDDAELFAAYTCLRNRPHVVVCLKSDVQEHRGTGITAEMRETETQRSMNILGCDWQQLPVSETNPDIRELETLFRQLRKDFKPERVWAPAVELGGHSHHNEVGQSAWNVFGVRVSSYMTYKRGFGRSKGKTTMIPTAGERDLKRQALNCYESQIRLENTAYWFTDESGWDREWVA